MIRAPPRSLVLSPFTYKIKKPKNKTKVIVIGLAQEIGLLGVFMDN